MRIHITSLPSVDQLAFSPDGQLLFAAGSRIDAQTHKPENRGLLVLHLSSERIERRLADECIANFRLHPQGRWLYYSGNSRPNTFSHRVLDLESLQTLSLGLNGDLNGMAAISSSGEWMVGVLDTGQPRSRKLVRWDITPDRPAIPVHERTFENHYLGDLTISPDGTTLASFEYDFPSANPADVTYQICVRNALDFEAQATTKSPSSRFGQLLFSPCGRFLVYRASRSMFVWQASNIEKKPQKVTIKTPQEFTAVAFHPSSRFLAATNNDTTVRFVDTTTWDVSTTYAWDIGKLKSVAFSPDGSLAAAGSDTGKIVVWDVEV